VTIYLVRHAKAGSRHEWHGDDQSRPLSKAGRRQADALAARLGELGVSTMVSSPFVRCVQTLAPLAEAVNGVVITDDCLGEGRHFDKVLALMTALPEGSVICSHGDVIPETIAALQRRGCTPTASPEWRKASVWVLERNLVGEFITATAWPPPDVDR
jgi:phosphohistidine phosphatase SixA